MKQLLLPLIVLALFAASPALAWRGTVDSAIACDSLVIKGGPPGQGAKVKLYGVVCPSPGADATTPQPYAGEALALLRELLPAELPVTVHDMRQDTMGRDKGVTITLPDGRIVQEELLRAGLAWVAPLHCGNCRHWKQLQKAARKAGAGLWRDEKPVPPWEWRERAPGAP